MGNLLSGRLTVALEMGFSIRFDQKIVGVTSDRAFGIIEDWLKAMRFEILQQASDVLVTVNISPSWLNASDVRAREEEAGANWNELLVGLWSRFGETGNQVVSKTRDIDWNIALKRGNTMILVGIVSIVIGVAASLANTSIFIVTLVAGVLLISNGMMNRRSAKKRKQNYARGQLTT